MEALMTYGVPGPKGDTGPTGATGPQGPRGHTGSSGSVSISSFRIKFDQYGPTTYSLSSAKLVIVMVSGYTCLVCGRGDSAYMNIDGGNKIIKLDASGMTLTTEAGGYSKSGDAFALS